MGKTLSRVSKYGEFIIQTNEVHYYLSALVMLRTFNPDNNFQENLERSQFGNLVGYFTICIKSGEELEVLSSLKQYKTYRDALAHKMFTNNKLKPDDCGEAIKLGEELITFLKEQIKKG